MKRGRARLNVHEFQVCNETGDLRRPHWDGLIYSCSFSSRVSVTLWSALLYKHLLRLLLCRPCLSFSVALTQNNLVMRATVESSWTPAALQLTRSVECEGQTIKRSVFIHYSCDHRL